MILTITLNPLLERRLQFSEVTLGTENRNGISTINAGGKGINVSRQLNKYGLKSFAFTMLGGSNGKLLKDILRHEGIEFTYLSTSKETRFASIIVENKVNRVSTYFEKNSSCTIDEANEFKNKLDKMIQNCEIVIFAGSSMCPETDDVFAYGIKKANEYDKISICDTYGNALEKCIKAKPTILHNNRKEIENSLNIELDTEEKNFKFLNELYESGIKQAYITDGGNNIYASNFNFQYVIEPVKIDVKDSTGSGDVFVASLAYGLVNDLTFEDTSKIAAAAGALNAETFDVCNIDPDDVLNLKDEIIIHHHGKKMKIVDVTPR